MDEYLGIIKIFGGNFAPVGWMMCQGQTINVSANTALFSILGNIYGGTPPNTFALPDLRGRVPIGFGQGTGLTAYTLGQKTGTETTTLTPAQMPVHNHIATGGGGTVKASSQVGTEAAPSATVNTLAASQDTGGSGVTIAMYNNQAPDITLNTGAGPGGGIVISNAGGSQPFSNLQPVLAVNYIICVSGLYPSRN